MPEPAPDSEPRRQFVSFHFYKVEPEWRRLPARERDEHRRAFADVIQRWRTSEQMTVLTYSLVGLRAEADIMLWRICYSLECMQQCEAELLRTPLGGYLTASRSFLAMTRSSQYKIGHGHEHVDRGVIRPGNHKYAFIYPFVKTRNWYLLPFEERQRIVSEYLRASEEFPRVRVNTLYSFGLDDQEFVLAVETDHPADMVDRIMRLRETENSAHVLHDTPVFTCLLCTPEEMLARLG